MNNLTDLKQEISKLFEENIQDPYTTKDKLQDLGFLISQLNDRCYKLIFKDNLDKLRVKENINKLTSCYPYLKWEYKHLEGAEGIQYLGKSDLITLDIRHQRDSSYGYKCSESWRCGIIFGKYDAEKCDEDLNYHN